MGKARGDTENPVTRADIADTFRKVTHAMLDTSVYRTAIDACGVLGQLADARELIGPLARS